MNVIRARALGMCFGVRGALAVARAVEDPAKVTIYGELVHNRSVMAELAERGFSMTAESQRDASIGTDRVLITAHGISSRERDRLKAAGKAIIDTTCPLVLRAHEAARQLADRGYFIVVIGMAGHVEVRGIVGDLDRFEVVSQPEDVRCYAEWRIGVVCQTTTSPVRAQAILERVEACNAGAVIAWAPTMCRATLERQAAVRSLLGRVEALVVIGGQNSNNTRELTGLARANGLPAFQVERAADLCPEWFSTYRTVGLTAGTSTPDEEIERVHARLLALGSSEALWVAGSVGMRVP